MNNKRRPDWRCLQCGDLVFGSKDKCRCGCFRSKSIPTERRPNDWDCPTCHVNIFGSKDKCFKCGSSNPAKEFMNEAQSKVVIGTIRSGDWLCKGCTTHNFASRIECFKCKLARPLESKDEDTSSKDECVVCMEAPKTMLINTCKHLAMCDVCAFTQVKCPICRTVYSPESDLVKIFTV